MVAAADTVITLREMLAIYIQGMILKQNAFRLLHSINCNFFSPDEFKDNKKSYIHIPHYCISVSYRYMYVFLLTVHIVAPANVSNLDIFCHIIVANVIIQQP